MAFLVLSVGFQAFEKVLLKMKGRIDGGKGDGTTCVVQHRLQLFTSIVGTDVSHCPRRTVDKCSNDDDYGDCANTYYT